jgi:beta,beta-carotene 9',10'-dioxygenase
VVNPTELLTSGKPFIRNYRWEPERGTRFQVFDRDTGEHLACCVGPPLFAFHHINAFVGRKPRRGAADRSEPADSGLGGAGPSSRGEKGEVVLDLAGYEDASIIDALYLDVLRDGEPEMPLATPWRLRLDLDRDTVSREVLSDQNIELPRVNERVSGRPYRYVWGTGNRIPGHFTDELVKIDVRTGEARSWYAEGCFPGEPVFVERPDAPPGPEGEDHGVLLSVVLDTRGERSFLLILDAATLEEEARATVPHPLPLGFHGQYYGQDAAGSG